MYHILAGPFRSAYAVRFFPGEIVGPAIFIKFFTYFGGERGIRTLDRLLTYTHFPGVLLQPLRHLSDTVTI